MTALQLENLDRVVQNIQDHPLLAIAAMVSLAVGWMNRRGWSKA
jgi:hypothetical protein